MRLASVGKWAFVVGSVIAGIAGVLLQAGGMVWVPALLGVVAGLLNSSMQETEPLLLAAVAFLLSSTGISNMALVGMLIDYFLGYAAVFVTGAMGVVALLALCRAVRVLRPSLRSIGRLLGQTLREGCSLVGLIRRSLLSETVEQRLHQGQQPLLERGQTERLRARAPVRRGQHLRDT